MADLAKLVVRLEAESSKLTTELERANRKLDSFGRKTESVASLAKKALGGIAAAVAVDKILEFSKSIIDAGDRLDEMSQKVGVSVANLQALEYTAKQSSVAPETLQKALVKLNTVLQGTAPASADAQKVLAALGVTSKSLLPAFYQLADGFAGTADGSNKLAAATIILGSRFGANMIPVLNGGSAALRENYDLLKRLGVLMDDETAAKMGKLNDEFDALKQALMGIAVQAGSVVVPELLKLTEQFVAWSKESGGIPAIIDRIASAIGRMTEAIKALAVAWAGGMVGGPVGAILAETGYLAYKGTKALGSPAPQESPTASGRITRTPAALAALNKPTDTDKSLAGVLAEIRQKDELAKRLADEKRLRDAAARAAEAQAKRIADLVAGFEEERDTLGMDSVQLAVYQAQKIGADAKTQAYVRTLAKQIAATKAATEADQRWAETRRELLGDFDKIVESLRSETEAIRAAYAQREMIVEMNVEAGNISVARGMEVRLGLYEKEAKEIADSADKNTNAISDFARKASENIQSYLGDSLYNVMQGQFDSIGGAFKQMLDRMVAEALASRINEALFGKSIASGEGGDLGGLAAKAVGWFGSIFGGKRAAGGPVYPSNAYLVGEKGPEMFVPSGAGRIVPNHQLGGGGVVVNINVSGIQDARGLRESASQVAARAGQAVNMAVRRNT